MNINLRGRKDRDSEISKLESQVDKIFLLLKE